MEPGFSIDRLKGVISMKKLTTLLKRNGITITDVKELSNGTVQYRLDNGCIVNQTCTGHIFLQGQKSEPVAVILAGKCPIPAVITVE